MCHMAVFCQQGATKPVARRFNHESANTRPILLIIAPFLSEEQKPALGLPELRTIRPATLSPSYSCRSDEER
jgi:hypothetical protein